MKKFKVENRTGTNEMICGGEPWSDIFDDFLGDYVKADNAEEAIEIAADCLKEECQNNGKDIIENPDDRNEFYVYDNEDDANEARETGDYSKAHSIYFDFRAIEMSE